MDYLNVTWFVLGCALALTGCSKQHSGQHVPLLTQGSVASLFTEGKPLALEGKRVVDSSVLEGRIFYDYGGGYSFESRSLSGAVEGSPVSTPVWLDFTYVFRAQGRLFLLGESRGDIYLRESLDEGSSWLELNGGAPVISHSADPNSNWNQLWNAAADIRPDGVWLFLIECSDSADGQVNVGLCYAEGALAPGGAFSVSRSDSEQAIPHAGNPYVKYLPGRGLLSAHGLIWSPQGAFGSEWFVTVSVRDEGDSQFRSFPEQFAIGTPGIHIADPHLSEEGGRLLLIVSSDQSHLTVASAQLTLTELYDTLTGGGAQ